MACLQAGDICTQHDSITSKIVSRTQRRWRMKGIGLFAWKSGTRRPRWRCSGSSRKQPRRKVGFGVLSNLKNSKDNPSQRIH
jgi:hypothetical protein